MVHRSTTMIFNECEGIIKTNIRYGFYNAADKIRLFQAIHIRTLEEDAKIFIDKK